MNKYPLIRIVIVNCLIRQDGLSGYDLIKFCRGFGIPASSGTVYPHLKSLEDAGIVEYREDGRRKLYKLTKEGRREMETSGLASAPEFLKNIFLKSLSLATRMDWLNKDEIKLLIENVSEIKIYLMEYMDQLA